MAVKPGTPVLSKREQGAPAAAARTEEQPGVRRDGRGVPVHEPGAGRDPVRRSGARRGAGLAGAGNGRDRSSRGERVIFSTRTIASVVTSWVSSLVMGMVTLAGAFPVRETVDRAGCPLFSN